MHSPTGVTSKRIPGNAKIVIAPDFDAPMELVDSAAYAALVIAAEKISGIHKYCMFSCGEYADLGKEAFDAIEAALKLAKKEEK